MGLIVAFESARGLALHLVKTAPLEAPSALALYAALLSILVKELLYQYQVRVARKLSSVSLTGDAWHHRSDAFSSICVAIGIAAAAAGGPRWAFADDAAALVVAIMLLAVGWQLFKESAAGLMDTVVPGEMTAEIRRVAASVDGVKGVEKTIARRSGLNVLVDIHVEVDGRLTVAEGHKIASAVTARLVDDIPQVTHALVHIEPHELAWL